MRICLRRREFIAALGGAAAWPLAARAGDRVRRIGVLMAGVERPLPVVGRRHQSDTSDRAELVGLQPDIILTVAIPATVAVQRETRTAV